MYSCALLDVEVGNCLEKTHLLPLARGALTHGEVDEIQIMRYLLGLKVVSWRHKTPKVPDCHPPTF